MVGNHFRLKYVKKKVNKENAQLAENSPHLVHRHQTIMHCLLPNHLSLPVIIWHSSRHGSYNCLPQTKSIACSASYFTHCIKNSTRASFVLANIPSVTDFCKCLFCWYYAIYIYVYIKNSLMKKMCGECLVFVFPITSR